MSLLVVGGVFREVDAADTNPTTRIGGSGLTASLVATALGAECALAGTVGADDAATAYAMLDAGGVARRFVIESPGASGTFYFPTHQSPERPWPMYRPAEGSSPAQSGLSASVVLLFGMPELDPLAAGWLSFNGEERLIFDRQGALSRIRDASSVGRVAVAEKIYVANQSEAAVEPGVGSSAKLQQLPPPGFDAAIIKSGEKGCLLVTEDVRRSIDGFPLAVESTVGSGDVFAGALAAGLVRGFPLDAAARLGNAAAAAYLRLGRDPLADGLPELTFSLLSA